MRQLSDRERAAALYFALAALELIGAIGLLGCLHVL